MTFQRLTALSATCLLTATAQAQLTAMRINELQLTPGAQILELKNHGSLAIDLAGWQLVTSGGQTPLPSTLVLADTTVLLHLGVPGSNTPLELYFPNAAPIDAVDTIALFRSPATAQPSELMDFVSLGGGQHGMNVAVLAGEWPSPQESILLSANSGQTLAHFDDVQYGSGDRPEDWFVDGTPTLGAANDGGGIFAGSWGCPGLDPYPVLGSGEQDNRPWIGESWQLDTYFLPPVQSTMWIAIGTNYTGPLALDPFGIANCMTTFQPYAITAYVVDANWDELQFTIPNHTALVGMQFYLQGLVSNYPTLNPAGIAATRVMHAIVGSR